MSKKSDLRQILIPIISNTRPYHELVMRGHLKLGEYPEVAKLLKNYQ